jgi:hypothetical protein
MSGSCGIPPNPPSIFDEAIDVDDDDVIDDDEKELIFEEVDPRVTEDPDPSNDPPPFPPIFIPSIIFFIMSSISRDIPPPIDGIGPPRDGMPPPRDGMGPPRDDDTMDDEDEDELENDIDDLASTFQNFFVSSPLTVRPNKLECLSVEELRLEDALYIRNPERGSAMLG